MQHLLKQSRLVPHQPIVAVIVVCVVVFLVEEVFGLELGFEYGARPVEFTAAWREFFSGNLTAASLSVLARLFTPLFLHGGPEHVLGNIVFLWAFGSLVSRLLGNWWAFGLFLLCGAAGNVTQICMKPDSAIPIIGASGGVAGLEGVYLGLALRWSLPWPDVFPLAHPVPPGQLALFACIGIGFDLYSVANVTGAGIAYGAHLGGFASGLAVALLVTTAFGAPESWQRKR
ncbi:MAG: rhomboid family intramembrane serine protease [Planctomycetota bacterium]|nr:rhomboid family intramembrane serine protease [Planctomycetota bacterium]MDA1163753.1 rhomboid family intramembrane serine protease [Planctomycetota bacterium]